MMLLALVLGCQAVSKWRSFQAPWPGLTLSLPGPLRRGRAAPANDVTFLKGEAGWNRYENAYIYVMGGVVREGQHFLLDASGKGEMQHMAQQRNWTITQSWVKPFHVGEHSEARFGIATADVGKAELVTIPIIKGRNAWVVALFWPVGDKASERIGQRVIASIR